MRICICRGGVGKIRDNIIIIDESYGNIEELWNYIYNILFGNNNFNIIYSQENQEGINNE